MVFNIASAGLIWTAYQQNSTVISDISSVTVTYTEYALAITQMALIIFGWFIYVCKVTIAVYKEVATGENTIVNPCSCFLFIIQVFNIVFSVYLIIYHNSQSFLPMTIINMSLAIIILNCLALCGCFSCSLKITDTTTTTNNVPNFVKYTHTRDLTYV